MQGIVVICIRKSFDVNVAANIISEEIVMNKEKCFSHAGFRLSNE